MKFSNYIVMRLSILGLIVILTSCGKQIEPSTENSASPEVKTSASSEDENSAELESAYDPDYGFSFEFNSNEWNYAPVPVSILGEPVVVLTNGPQLPAIMVVFVRSQLDSEPVTDARMESLSEKLTGMAPAIGAKVISNEIQEVAGRKAVSLQISGPGTGVAIGAGPTPTTQHWYAFPRGQDLIVFQLTTASDKLDDSFESFQKMVESATIEDSRSQRENPIFENSDIGLSISYPSSPWVRGGYELGDFLVPGYCLRLWSAPSKNRTTDNGTTAYANRLAMFMQFPDKAYTPQELIDMSIPGLTQTGAKVVTNEIREIAGKQAMWLLVEGTSKSGANLTGQGDVPTRQLWVAIPRVHNGANHNIVVFLLNAPSEDYDECEKEFKGMLETLEIED